MAFGYQSPSSREDEDSEPLLTGQTPHETSSPSQTSKKSKPSPLFFLIVCLFFSFILSFGGFLGSAPGTRIFENIVCRNYYNENHPDELNSYPDEIPEDRCKMNEVQEEVAFVQGMAACLDAVPSLLLSIPFAKLADTKIGRRPILILSVLGITLSAYWTLLVCWFPHIFPLRAVFFGATFLLIGGGLSVTNAMVTTMITDIFEPENRATVFFQMALGPLFAQLLAPPLASWMMQRHGAWPTYLLSLACFTVGVPFLGLVPETVGLRPSKKTDELDDEALDDEALDDGLDDSGKGRLRSYLRKLLKSSAFITKERSVMLLLSTSFLTILSRSQLNVLLLYISKRYQVPLSKAAVSLSVLAAANILLFLIVFPAASIYFTKKLHFSAESKDLWMSKFSVIFLTLGCFAIGLAPTIATMTAGLVVYTLGSGFNALSLSLISVFVDQRYAARLYSVVCVVSTAGAFVGAPLLAALFNIGLRTGRPEWTGLPFLGTGILHVFVAIAVWFVRLPPPLPGSSPSLRPASESEALLDEEEATPLVSVDQDW